MFVLTYPSWRESLHRKKAKAGSSTGPSYSVLRFTSVSPSSGPGLSGMTKTLSDMVPRRSSTTKVVRKQTKMSLATSQMTTSLSRLPHRVRPTTVPLPRHGRRRGPCQDLRASLTLPNRHISISLPSMRCRLRLVRGCRRAVHERQHPHGRLLHVLPNSTGARRPILHGERISTHRTIAVGGLQPSTTRAGSPIGPPWLLQRHRGHPPRLIAPSTFQGGRLTAGYPREAAPQRDLGRHCRLSGARQV